MGLEMEVEDNSELEEGEACYYKDDDEIIDPDIDLSYIDEKIQHVLGHFQKDFEGGVSAENLGAKFGGYGSFLPTYERSPSVWSHPKTPQKHQSTSRSPNNLPMEGASQVLKASSSAHPSVRLGTVSCSDHPLHNSKLPSEDVSVKRNSCLPSLQVADKCSSKDETSNGSGSQTDQRTLKFRIKMSSDTMAKKNALYSGLGLYVSPSSSSGNSSEENGEMAPMSRGTVDESPTNILKVLTSCHIPGDSMISPLHDSLLSLIRKEKNFKASKLEHSLESVQEHSGMLVDEPVSIRREGKEFKEKRTKLAGKSKRQDGMKHGNGPYFENDIKIRNNMTSEKEITLGKGILSKSSKCTPLPNSICDGGVFLKVTGQESEDSREANKDDLKGRLFSCELPKEELLGSIFGQDCGKNGKQNSRGGFIEQFSEQRVSNSFKDAPGDLRDDNRSMGNKISAILGSYSDVSKLEEDLDPLKQSVGQKSTSNELDKKKLPRKKEKQSFEGNNKSKKISGNSKPASVSTKESLRVEKGAVRKDKMNTSQGVAPCNNKMLKLKSHDNSKVRYNNSDLLRGKDFEAADNRVDPRERHMADRPHTAALCNVEVDRKTFLDKPKETLSCKKADEQLMLGLSLKDAPNNCPPVVENGLTSHMATAMVAPVVIEEDWVCCDSCQQWRLLPFGIKPEQLPEKWLCSMLNWLPGMNRCDISEEETTKKLRALYQLPVSESQNNLENHVSSASFQLLDQNNPNFPSGALSNQGKKRHGLKEISNVGSGDSPSRVLNPTKSHLFEPVKSRSLNDMNQSPLDNRIKKSSSQHMSKPGNLEKNTSKQTEKQVNGGNTKELRNKSKRDSDQYACETSKRLKTEDMFNTAKHQGSDFDSGKTDLNLIMKAKVKELKNDEYCLQKDANCEAEDAQISVKKLEDKSRVSLYGGSSDTKTCTVRDSSTKKRKMKHWQDNHAHMDAFDNSVHDGKIHKDQTSESGFRKEKKLRISRNNGKEPSTNCGNDKLNSKDRVTQITVSGVKRHQVDEMEKDGVIDNDHQRRKQGGKKESQQALDGVFSLKKDLESGHLSAATTSSSSKISSSHKIRGNFGEVKGSPVESVSSSPFRTSNSDKLMSAAGDVFRKDDAVNGGLQSVRNSKRSLTGTNGETNELGTLRQEKISSNVPSESKKLSTLDCKNRDASHDFSAEGKRSSEVLKSHLLSGNVDAVDQHCGCPSDQRAVEYYHDEARLNNNHHKVACVQHKSSKLGSTLQSEDEEKKLTSDLDRGKMKVADPVSEYSQRNQKYDSKVDPNHLAPGAGTTTDVKNSFVKKLSIKSANVDKTHSSRKDHAIHGSSDKGMESQVKRRDNEGSDLKLGAKYSANGKTQDSEGFPVKIESKSHKSKLLSRFESDGKSEAPILSSQPVPGSDMHPVAKSVNDDGPKIKQSGSASNQIRVYHSTLHLSPDREGATDANASSPVRNSSDLTATKTLKEAKDLRDYADRLKSSGFASESSEAYFQAALKFLHGAALLESCSSEGGKYGGMPPTEVYISTAKLCELCAHDYERRREMAAAALAYKCMEVSYMRVAYCKNPSTNRDRHELQATLHMIPQGESPSSSASDVDNLNTQVTVEKATLSRGASHVTGNHVIVARNRSSFVRVLDFTQYVIFAMEASRKSLDAFMAANATLEEAQNKDCIASIRRVVQLSFQDIEELIHLVRLARESISRSGFCGARD
ncbi:Zinc finger, CW-type [Trema orientale]|uniref:Zinc finger, CW-type n=1 Tax=Trema orientale TaxID=63057 RepID=A0A2P5ERW2_TREOI|nr:Zinc finger, CW-type [Trema orientale]